MHFDGAVPTRVGGRGGFDGDGFAGLCWRWWWLVGRWEVGDCVLGGLDVPTWCEAVWCGKVVGACGDALWSPSLVSQRLEKHVITCWPPGRGGGVMKHMRAYCP